MALSFLANNLIRAVNLIGVPGILCIFTGKEAGGKPSKSGNDIGEIPFFSSKLQDT